MSRLNTRSIVVVAFVLSGSLALGCDRPSSGGGTTSNGVVAPQSAPGGALPQQAASPQAQEQAPAGAPTSPDVASFDDTNIAAALQSVHQRIAAQAQLAEHSARSGDVKKLSRELEALHSDVLNSEQSLYQRLNLVPRASAASQQIDTDATNAIQTLRGDRGATFDRDYLDTQSRTFQEAIALFDRMYSRARNPDLKSEIGRTRPDLVAGMQSVTQLQQTMNAGVTSMQGK